MRNSRNRHRFPRLPAPGIDGVSMRLLDDKNFPHAMSEEQLGGYLTELRDGWPAGEREFQQRTLLEPVPALVDWLYAVANREPSGPFAWPAMRWFSETARTPAVCPRATARAALMRA